MMTVTVNPPSDCMFTVSKFFDLNYMDDWFDDETVRRMVLDVDKTEVINAYTALSPVLGNIPIERISGGVKGLIMILKDPDKRVYSSTIFGGNCVPWITKLSSIVDFTIVMEHSLEFNSNTPITAQTPDGVLLRTEWEVWNYYIDNYPKRNNASNEI